MTLLDATEKIGGFYTENLGYPFQDIHRSRVFLALQHANVITTHVGPGSKFLLREMILISQSAQIPRDHSPHFHARKAA